ncbi:LamG-like jellyroll fold domain-containing protein [Propionispora hippei]|uniref:Fibronectin type III domain-containing protein n=1 Tax=Propionispora hippei DSM 15287 TaxID=1123003 RepID=A0A1M6CYS2_9FIRM|nr:LamG-like jellyroll fold domain-containing protein [Propionispora hippei]SHI66023.1 Fibronectin type III domain-containing protein [Propionispora hippei DSM 15287]
MAYELDQYTVSLLHFEDGIKDETGKVWTAQNGATISSDKLKFGGASLLLNGTNQYLTVPNSSDFDFGSGDFTIDWWEYRTAITNTNEPVFARNCDTAFQAFLVGVCSTLGPTMISCHLSSNNSSWDIASGKLMGKVILNQWTHYALCRKASTFYTFQNGMLQETWSSSASLAPSSGTPGIGKYPYIGYFHGYIDEFRVSKGIARWTADFTPPGTAVLPNVPTNLTATPGDSQVTLNWEAITGATGYNLKRSTTAGGPYETIATNVAGTSCVDTNVVNGTTYYYVVTAINADGESANSNEALATPQAEENPPSSGKALLRVTMIDSSEREYRLDRTEIDGFVNWYIRTIGTGISCYSVNDIVDGSKEYLAFEKIISFKVIPLPAE